MSISTSSTDSIGLQQIIAFVGLGLVVILVVGNFLGMPLLLSFVETGSMEPTIMTGDGFVALPTAVTGDVETGDVIVFDAVKLDGGGLTTHRVVDETSEGYITQGDANIEVDQRRAEPPVTDERIVAVAWQPRGEVVVVPYLGSVAETIQGVVETVLELVLSVLDFGSGGSDNSSQVLFLLGAGLLVYSAVAGDESRDTSRSRSRSVKFDPRGVLFTAGLIICVVSLLGMGIASNTSDLVIISAEFDSVRADVIPAGTTDSMPYTRENGGLLPIVSVLESSSESVTVGTKTTTLFSGESTTQNLTVTAPPETGQYSLPLEEHQYLAVLPPSVIVGLHAIHPWVAMGTITAIISVSLLVPLGLILGFQTFRSRSRADEKRSRT